METLMFVLDCFFDVAYLVIMNLQRVLFNYFGGLIVVIVQMIGFYYMQMKPSGEVDPLLEINGINSGVA